MQKLNLPGAPLKLTREPDGTVKVFDPLRLKWLVLTPEEWVRQNFVAYLTGTLGYPAGLMGNEISITLNGTTRRCDTVIFNRDGSPLMIVEYKAPHITISQQTFDQIVRYNMVLHARYLTVSNGLCHYCCEIDYQNHTYRFLPSVPAAELNFSS